MTSTPEAPDEEEFYVGYLPAPPNMLAFVKIVAPLLLALTTALGAALAFHHADTGPGEWRAGETVDVKGVLELSPYPAVRVFLPTGATETVLLSTQGKGVPLPRMDGLIGEAVAIRGQLVEREGRKLLTVVDGADAIQASKTDYAIAGPETETIGSFTLKGEIVDPKCWFGVMKPGYGKTHKICGALCLLGGIAPMFVTTAPSGVERAYLLTDMQGGIITPQILSYVADPIEVSGEIARRGDVLLYKIDPATIRRL